MGSTTSPTYSPDLSPCDFDLFPKLKHPLRGVRYSDFDELMGAVTASARCINDSCLATGIRMLPGRWETAIRHEGEYLEGM